MKKLIVVVVAVGIIGSAALYVTQKDRNQIVSIGAVLPLTGAVALSGGEQCREGIEIAVETINKNGGIHSLPIQLTIEDSQSNTQTGVSALLRLINMNKPIAVVSMTSGLSKSMAPVMAEHGVPLLTTITSDPEVTTVNDFVYRYYPLAEEEVRPMVKIAEDKGVKTFGVLYLNDAFGHSILKSLEDQFEGTVVGEPILPTDTSFETPLLKLKVADPDAILVVGYNGQILTVAKEMKTLGLTSALFVPSNGSAPLVREGLSSIDAVAYGPASSMYRGNVATVDELKRQYVERGGTKTAFDHFAVSCYDTVMLLAQVLETEDATALGVTEGLKGLQKYSGLMGDVTIHEKEISFPLYPVEYRNGEVVFLDLK